MKIIKKEKIPALCGYKSFSCHGEFSDTAGYLVEIDYGNSVSEYLVLCGLYAGEFSESPSWEVSDIKYLRSSAKYFCNFELEEIDSEEERELYSFLEKELFKNQEIGE